MGGGTDGRSHSSISKLLEKCRYRVKYLCCDGDTIRFVNGCSHGPVRSCGLRLPCRESDSLCGLQANICEAKRNALPYGANHTAALLTYLLFCIYGTRSQRERRTLS